MTTVVTTSNSEVATPASYISRWIAQSHGSYQKRANEFYSSSPSCDCQSSSDAHLHSTPTKANGHSHTTTWQAQARSRFDATSTTLTDTSSYHDHDNELQEKLHRVRALLDAKKQRSCHQVHRTTAVGDPPASSPTLSPSPINLVLENLYHSHDEPLSSSHPTYAYNTCPHHHHHHHSLPSILPCLVEESPSDSGLSDGTKTTQNDDMNDSPTKNAALIDLSKPLSKEEMLAIIQIVRELWRKQFDSDMPDVQIQSSLPTSAFPRRRETTPTLSTAKRTQYHSTPALNKLTADLTDIKDKLKRFSTDRQQAFLGTKSNTFENISIETDDNPGDEDALFVTVGAPMSPETLERMQEKKDALIRRQIQRREEQLIKKSERQAAAAERQDEYRLFEEYISQRRQEDDHRRTSILHAHVEQKRLEADPPSTNDYYFAAARSRNRLKRKASLSSFVSFDDELSYADSSLDLFGSRNSSVMQTSRRSLSRFDLVSASLTAPTAASRSKMNRAASTCNINGHYDSFASLNSKATMPLTKTPRPPSFFGGSLMNLSRSPQPMQLLTPSKRSMTAMDEAFDLANQSLLSTSMTSLATSMAGARLARSQTLFTTKSNKQAILNSLKQVALAGPANEQQRAVVTREIEASEARHFVLLFRDHRLQFRALYMYIPETDIIEKLHGVGPNIITEIMVDKWFKYNSGRKRFTSIPIKHFSIQCDAIIIHNDFWQKKLLMHMNKRH